MLGVESFKQLINMFQDMRAFLMLLIQLNLIFLKRCPKSFCRIALSLGKCDNYKDGYAAWCKKCRVFRPLSRSGFFVETRLNLQSIFQILYCWANGIGQKQCVAMTNLSKCSINQWYRYARDVASWKLLQDEELFMFGEPGCIVQIDESVVSRRKYNRGKRVVSRWVLGIYDCTTKRGLVVYVPRRDEATLIPIIQAHVRPGTEIWTDSWAAYNTLQKRGYIHRTVNHSKHFKDPVTGVCTNQVEGFWGVMKRELRKKCVNSSRHLVEHIDEFMWRTIYLQGGQANPLDTLLQHICEKYPE